ncbi:hypothetical protein CYY_001565 [Polysphondylium violaceum]|uniref:BRCT domain-containing protein n=1 Tax=Polysphondylium violaceum TaxID=133409 RepID=A0A8J4PY18_9MYCE|nr:hypothetical protein CYY_001565 [Polysphondylium violaceum]
MYTKTNLFENKYQSPQQSIYNNNNNNHNHNNTYVSQGNRINRINSTLSSPPAPVPSSSSSLQITYPIFHNLKFFLQESFFQDDPGLLIQVTNLITKHGGARNLVDLADSIYVFAIFDQNEEYNQIKSMNRMIIGVPYLKECVEKNKPLNLELLATRPIYSECLAGLSICTSGFNDENKNYLCNTIEVLSAEYQRSISPTCTHLIHNPEKHFVHKKMTGAANFRIPIVTPNWLADCWGMGKRLDTKPYEYPLFFGCTISITNFKASRKEKIKDVIQKYGGIYNKELNRQSTHLIANKQIGFSEKCKLASSFSIPIVNIDWFHESIREGFLQNVAKYSIADNQLALDVSATNGGSQQPIYNSMVHTTPPTKQLPRPTPIPSKYMLNNSSNSIDYDNSSLVVHHGHEYENDLMIEGHQQELIAYVPTLFHGKNFILKGFEEDEYNSTLRQVQAYATVIDGNTIPADWSSTTMDIHYIIAPHEKNIRALLGNNCTTPVVSIIWFNKCVNDNIIYNPKDCAAFTPIRKTNIMTNSYSISTTGFNETEISFLRMTAKLLGARFTSKVFMEGPNATTHLIANKDKLDSLKAKSVRQNTKIHIVSPEWLNDCAEKGCVVRESLYYFQPNQFQKQYQNQSVSSSNFQQQQIKSPINYQKSPYQHHQQQQQHQAFSYQKKISLSKPNTTASNIEVDSYYHKILLKDCIIFLSGGLSNADLTECQQKIQELGGVTTNSFYDKVTHYICDVVNQTEISSFVETKQIKPVSTRWLQESWKKKIRQLEKDYPPIPHRVSNQLDLNNELARAPSHLLLSAVDVKLKDDFLMIKQNNNNDDNSNNDNNIIEEEKEIEIEENQNKTTTTTTTTTTADKGSISDDDNNNDDEKDENSMDTNQDKVEQEQEKEEEIKEQQEEVKEKEELEIYVKIEKVDDSEQVKEENKPNSMNKLFQAIESFPVSNNKKNSLPNIINRKNRNSNNNGNNMSSSSHAQPQMSIIAKNVTPSLNLRTLMDDDDQNKEISNIKKNNNNNNHNNNNTSILNNSSNNLSNNNISLNDSQVEETTTQDITNEDYYEEQCSQIITYGEDSETRKRKRLMEKPFLSQSGSFSSSSITAKTDSVQKHLLYVLESHKAITPTPHQSSSVSSPKKKQPIGVTLTGFDSTTITNYKHAIAKIGGYVEERFVPNKTSHLIVFCPNQSEKLLSACAAGIWILTSEYLEASFKQGSFVDEASYEWIKAKKEKVEEVSKKQSGKSDPRAWAEISHRCRVLVLSSQRKLFSKAKIAMWKDTKNIEIYSCILRAGGADVEIFDNIVASSLSGRAFTHVIAKPGITKAELESSRSEFTHIGITVLETTNVVEYIKSVKHLIPK